MPRDLRRKPDQAEVHSGGPHWWYETCDKRYAPGSDALTEVVEAVLREELGKTLPQLAAPSLTPEQAEDALADLREDTGRWLKDRNDRLVVESRKTSNGMASQGQLYSGAHLAALAGLSGKRCTSIGMR